MLYSTFITTKLNNFAPFVSNPPRNERSTHPDERSCRQVCSLVDLNLRTEEEGQKRHDRREYDAQVTQSLGLVG